MDYYVVAYTRLTKLETEQERYDSVGVREYEELNPVFTESVCKGYAKHNCKTCFGTGLNHWSRPRQIKFISACSCVRSRIEKMDESVKRAILGIEENVIRGN